MKAETIRIVYDHLDSTLQISTRRGDSSRAELEWMEVGLTNQQLANLLRDASAALSSRMNQGFEN